jgi:hypothetical protein
MTIESKRLEDLVTTLDDVMASIGSAQDDLPSGQAGLVYAYEPVADQVCHLLREILSLRADKAKMMEAVTRNQWMLENIDRSQSTNFREVAECIVANRAILTAISATMEQQ